MQMALVDAVIRNDMVEVSRLLRTGVDVDHKGQYEQAPLMYASSEGMEDMVRVLLSAGANPNDRTENKVTPLGRACSNGHAGVVTLLLKSGVDPNGDNDRMPPISSAAMGGHLEVVTVLLDHGADIHTRDSVWKSPILAASITRRGLRVIHTLLDRGANINDRDTSGRTPLMVAAGSDNVCVILLLLEMGADSGVKGRDGRTAYDMSGCPIIRNAINYRARSIYTNKDRSRSYMDDRWSDMSVLFSS